MARQSKKDGRPRALRGVLRGPGDMTLARLGARTRELARQQRRLQQALPRDFAGEWQLARLDTEELALVANSPVWASQLRYRQTELLDAAQWQIGQRPRRCRITIEPPRLQRRRAGPRHLSADSARLLEATANDCDNPKLAAALRRLASRGPSGGDDGE